jgi:hypothetical protein
MTDLYIYYLLARIGWIVALLLLAAGVVLAVRLRAANRRARTMSLSHDAQWLQVAHTFGWPR